MGCGQSLLEWFGVYKKRAVPLLAEYKQVEHYARPPVKHFPASEIFLL
jgi:hypothetical protein